MGRKAKDAAQQKIGEWTGSRRNVSKTTTKSENTNASNENRTPLQTHSQSDINAMKNCTVRLEIMRLEPKTSDAVAKIPVKKVSDPTDTAADVITKDKQADAKNVYDIFDIDDEPGPMKETEDGMKDLFEKLAKENIIEVKKYRPKNVGKKKKPDDKAPAKKDVTQKRRREKQATDVEPPQKKPNLKARVAKADDPKSGTTSASAVAVPPKRNLVAESLANNNIPTKKVTFQSKQTVNTNVAVRSSPRKQANPVNVENVNAQPRLRNRVLDNFQSTPKPKSAPKSSTPLGTKATAQSKENDRSLNSLFFDNASPLVGSARATRGKIQKHRLQLSAIEDSREEVATTKPAQTQENGNAPQIDIVDDDDDFDFGNNLPNDPEPDVDDKENSWDQPSTSAAALSAQNKPGTSKAASSLWDQPSTSAAALRALDRPGTSATTSKSTSNVQKKPTAGSSALRSRDQPSTSSAAQTPRRETDHSIFDIQDTSEPNIFSPTKRVQRVYGRSPLKNITSEVNNTNSPSFDSIKSMPRSFGTLPKSTANSIQTVNSTKETSLTLPEASYFSSRRAAQDFDRNVDNQNFIDNCFGFDDIDDEEVTDEPANKESENDKTIDNDVTKTEAEKLKEIRSRLKRFLQNPDAEPNESVKMAKVTKPETLTDKNKAKKGKTPKKTPMKTPTKSPSKAVSIPERPKRNIVFGDTGAKQKDIRSAFTVKTTDKHSKADKSKNDPVLFEEVETVQDRRRSYSRPQRHRKRRISIDSDESEEEEEEQHSDDEDFDENGKSTKRAKRRKKTAEPNHKELEELDEFAKQLNEHFKEIDSFDVVVEPEHVVE